MIWEDHSHFAWWNLALVVGGLLRDGEAPLWTLVCFWLPFWIWYSADAPFAALSAAFAIFFAWATWRMPDEPQGWLLSPLTPPSTLLPPTRYSTPRTTSTWACWPLPIGGIHLLLARRYESRSDAQNLILGVAIAFVTLAIPIQFAGFRVTIAWALEGAVLAWLSARSENYWLRAGCWSVLTLAVFRLLVLDAFLYSQSSEYSMLVNTRFLTFAVSTAALWLSAKFLAPALDAAVAYIAGHAVFLFGLSLEIGGWVGRNVLPENQSGVQIIAISVMLTIYAVILVVIGVKIQAAIHRMLGLALVVLVVAKLYLVDVWVLGRLFRITAFLALGVLLLALSYLYSRLRPVLDRLLRDDPSRVN